jgi:hypothetical protein
MAAGTGGSAGGGGAPETCTSDSDCDPGDVCEQGKCLDATCVDGMLGGSESDVDCGGDCLPCAEGKQCNGPEDCATMFCDDGSVTAGTGGAGGGGVGGSGGSGGAGGAATGGGGAAPSGPAVCAACDDDADCAPVGGYCDAGTCSDGKDNGETCSGHAQCASGFCPPGDGVCCDDTCNSGCEACVASKTGSPDGTCAPVTADTDPDSECADLGAASCGADGSGCNGDVVSPGCNVYPSGTECAATGCSAGMSSDASSCDGDGTCVPSNPVACAPYACDSAGSACLTTCTTNVDCDASSYCNTSGACVAKKALGDGCGDAGECQSGFCPGDDGVCCDMACSGTCSACLASKTGGTNGSCGFIPNGQDPDNECLLSCGGNGACSL